MRSRRVCCGFSGGSTNTVSERFISRVACRICASDRPRPSGKTARGLPPKTRRVKTSAVRKRCRTGYLRTFRPAPSGPHLARTGVLDRLGDSALVLLEVLREHVGELRGLGVVIRRV